MAENLGDDGQVNEDEAINEPPRQDRRCSFRKLPRAKSQMYGIVPFSFHDS